jgi:hypothetical protein
VKSNLAEQFVSLRRALEAEGAQLASRLKSINDALGGGEIPIPSTAGATPVAKTAGRRKGGMSAAGRARVAAAQRARWAKIKASRAGREVPTPAKAPGRPKRKISAAGRARIAAAQKARWAKIKTEKK